MDTPLEAIRRAEIEGLRECFPPGTRVLEIGGGSGFQASIIASWGCSVVSVDIADKPDPIRQGFQKQYFPVQPYDREHLPFPDRQFDVVYTSNMLYHVQDLPGFLAEIRRTLVPDGRVIHVLPSSGWRCATCIAHYRYSASVVFKKISKTISPQKHAAETAGIESPQPAIRRSFAQRLADLMVAKSLTPNRGVIREAFDFRASRWVEIFRANGFRDVEVRPNGLFYTGYLPRSIDISNRRRLARIFGSACNVITMRAGNHVRSGLTHSAGV